jgi:acyl carrier protein
MVTKEDVRKILATSLNMSIKELEDDTLLVGGEIESLAYVEILLELEAKYKMTTSDEDLKDIKTIGDLTQLVMNKVNANHQNDSILQKI